jgi:hypothetical protein
VGLRTARPARAKEMCLLQGLILICPGAVPPSKRWADLSIEISILLRHTKMKCFRKPKIKSKNKNSNPCRD